MVYLEIKDILTSILSLILSLKDVKLEEIRRSLKWEDGLKIQDVISWELDWKVDQLLLLLMLELGDSTMEVYWRSVEQKGIIMLW